ncbi:MAG TPA: DUF3574 domain-containing protein [Thermoanaerobaculia bacterium]|nr:DUF3574 domain-containing protein [Thermoanaerobaculia bacterium]
MKVRALALVLLLSTACTHAVSDRLFCGRSIPDGGTVSDEQLAAFITEVVEPRFPEGFSVWRARGHWRGGYEDTVVFEFVRPADPRLERAVAEIADAYRTRFRQEAVLRVRTRAKLDFAD